MQKTLLLVIGKQNAASPHLVAESWPGNGPRGELRAEACRTSPRRFRVADRGHNSRAAAAAAVDAADWPDCEQSARKRWRRRECYIGATAATTLILTKLAWHADWLSSRQRRDNWTRTAYPPIDPSSGSLACARCGGRVCTSHTEGLLRRPRERCADAAFATYPALHRSGDETCHLLCSEDGFRSRR